MKLKNKVLAALLGVSMLLCSCSESSSQTNISSSSKAQTEQTTTTTQQTSEQTTTTSATEQTSQTETSSQSPEQKTPQGVPMWEGTAPNGNKITFIGSMHAAKSDFYPLPDKIKNAYQSCEVLAVECDANAAADDPQYQIELQKEMTITDGKKLKDLLSAEAYQVLGELLAELNATPEVFENFKPWAAYESINAFYMLASPISTNNGLDYYLINQAKTDAKQLVELESVQVQTDMLTKQSDKTYDALIRASKGTTKKQFLDDLEKMYDAWLKGDLDYIRKVEAGATDEEMKAAGLSDEDIALIRANHKITVDDRNVGMVENIKKLFSNGKNTLVMVGVAHYFGESGIISLLEKQGYTFKRI